MCLQRAGVSVRWLAERKMVKQVFTMVRHAWSVTLR